MRIVFNTRSPGAPASIFYAAAFEQNNKIVMFDQKNYHQYDVALFMTYEDDVKDLVRAKKQNPSLKTGLIDPRGSFVKKYLDFIDFFIVDSIEMKDFFAGFQKPILAYYEFPNITPMMRKHHDKARTIIGYHGNKVHLEGMFPNITKALELLGNKYDIEFRAIYNISSLGISRAGMPKNIPVKHIQWDETIYEKELSKVDIGIVPSLMPIKNLKRMKQKSIVFKKFFNDNEDDYLIKFKMPSNAGRIIVFGLMGIPVVSDLFPSALQLIRDEDNGLLAYSCGGWYKAIETLINSSLLRQSMADNMQKIIDEKYRFQVQNERLNKFLEETLLEGTHTNHLIIDEPRLTISRNKDFWLGIVENYWQTVKRIVKNKNHSAQ